MQCYRLLEGQNSRAWKGLYVNCRDFFYAEDFVGRIVIMLLNFKPLRSADIYKTMPRDSKKRKSRGGTRKRASKQTLQVEPQTNEVQPQTVENSREKCSGKCQLLGKK